LADWLRFAKDGEPFAVETIGFHDWGWLDASEPTFIPAQSGRAGSAILSHFGLFSIFAKTFSGVLACATPACVAPRPNPRRKYRRGTTLKKRPRVRRSVTMSMLPGILASGGWRSLPHFFTRTVPAAECGSSSLRRPAERDRFFPPPQCLGSKGPRHDDGAGSARRRAKPRPRPGAVVRRSAAAAERGGSDADSAVPAGAVARRRDAQRTARSDLRARSRSPNRLNILESCSSRVSGPLQSGGSGG
jgi:hypothetical protein